MIDMVKFYLIAGLLMFIAFLGNIWNLVILWNVMTWGARISTLAGGVLFSLLLVILFVGFYLTMRTPQDGLNNPKLDKLIDSLKEKPIKKKLNSSIKRFNDG